MYVPCPAGAENGACGVPSITVLKICVVPVTATCIDSDVPEKRATNPVPDQAKRGRAESVVVSTRPNQRTPAATTPATGGGGPPASAPASSPASPPAPDPDAPPSPAA